MYDEYPNSKVCIGPAYARYIDDHACHPPIFIIEENAYIFNCFRLTNFDIKRLLFSTYFTTRSLIH